MAYLRCSRTRARVHAPRQPVAEVARRTVDFVIALLLLTLLAVPMLIIAIFVWLDDGGPAFFRQERVGLHRSPFTMLKFRTMTVGVHDDSLRDLIERELRGEDTAVNGSSKLNGDRRVTQVGAFLRRTSLDELPQLINVVRGDMALVGPRPCLEWEAELFPVEFGPRFRVRPGLTGLWQVSGRSTLGTLDMLRLDVRYVHTRSVRLDVGILLRTVPTLLRRDGAR